ncbi:MAG: class I SAM-dependent methyltransferase [Actinomycetota bacterium]|nr:class I SAM-dependent methyltransferase [Actinomycetota bacterium]
MRKKLRRLAPRALLWRRGLPTEVAFWERFLRLQGAEWPDDYRQRLTPGAPITEPLILERLPLLPSPRLSVLDVGAGPASSLGSALPDRQLELIAVDPLAEEYNRLLSALGLAAPVPVARCRGEDVLDMFGRDRFDIAYARNSLDHTVDPAATIRGMLAVIRPGGFVILRHWRNEGQKAGYEDLHQWNLDAIDGDLMIWDERRRHTLTDLIPNPDYVHDVALAGPVVTAVVHRRPPD